MKAFQIFKPGKHKPIQGEARAFSEGVLKASAAAYDPAKHEAPIVIGHPAGPAPAFGWVAGLKFEEGALVAEPKQVEAQFEELVRDGRYKQRSAAFYTPDAEANPVPGAYYLQHVAFLGAAAPSVKGLAPVEFAGAAEDVVTIQFGEWEDRTIGRLFRGLRDHFIEILGLEKADEILPSWDVDNLQEEAKVPDTPPPAFSEPDSQPQPQTQLQEDPMDTETKDKEAAEAAAKLEDDQNTLASGQEALEKEKAAFSETQRTTEAASSLDALVKDGKVLPAERDGLAKFMAGLGADDTVQFAEGEDGEITPVQFFTNFLDTLPNRVDFAERAAARDGEDAGDGDPAAVAQQAVAYQEEMKGKGIVVSADKAVRHVIAQAQN